MPPPSRPLGSPSMALDIALDELQVRLLHPAARPPVRSRAGDAGYDLRCSEGFALWPREHATVPTGVAIALPAGGAGPRPPPAPRGGPPPLSPVHTPRRVRAPAPGGSRGRPLPPPGPPGVGP